MQTILTKIVSLIIAPVLFLGGIISPIQAPTNVGAVLPQATGVFETSLASPINSTATSMTLTSNSVRGGGAVSGYTCFTVDEGSAQAEVICGTVTATAVASLTRGVSYADGITSVTANKFSHRRGANVKITDFPLVQILKAQNNGDATFPNKISYASHPTLTADTDIADKKYIDDIAIAGGVDSTTTVKGISKMSVAPASSTSPIAVGDNDGRVPTQNENNALVGNNTDIAVGTGNKFMTQTGSQHNAEKYAADAGANDSYAITLSPVPTSYTNGMIVYFKANTINTGAATLDVNSLGAKTIVKGISTTLVDGDIAAGQFSTVIYDGTNFVLQNPVFKTVSTDATGKLPALDGSALTNLPTVPTIGATTATALDYVSSTSTTITHNLGVIPRFIRITTIRLAPGGNNQPSLSTGIATIDNSNGNISAQYVSGNGDTGTGDQIYYTASYISTIFGASGAYSPAPLSGVTSTQMTITFGGTGYGTITPGGTMTYLWEVYK